MGKLANYILVMSGLMLLFYFGGLLENTGSSTLLNLLLNPEGWESTNLFTKTITIIATVGTVGVVVGALLGNNVEFAIFSSIVVYLSGLFWDFLSVFGKVYEGNAVFAILFFSPIFILWIVTLVEFFRGTD